MYPSIFKGIIWKVRRGRLICKPEIWMQKFLNFLEKNETLIFKITFARKLGKKEEMDFEIIRMRRSQN
jgi:GT2 family glycosyltransferase